MVATVEGGDAQLVSAYRQPSAFLIGQANPPAHMPKNAVPGAVGQANQSAPRALYEATSVGHGASLYH
jgi:hypothetical protein